MVETFAKQIRIVSSRPRQEIAVELTPNDTASSVLEKANLDPNDLLMKPGDQREYEPTEAPFDDVPDGGKLHVVPHSSVGV